MTFSIFYGQKKIIMPLHLFSLYLRKKNTLFLFFILISYIPLLSASEYSDNNKQQYPLHIIDEGGKSIVIPHKPMRIVSQTLGTDEILLAICPTERLVALSLFSTDPRYSLVVEQAKQVKGRVTQSAEQILGFKPDLVFAASYTRAELMQLLEQTNIPVYRFTKFGGIDDVIQHIRLLGQMIDEKKAAEKLIASMENDIKNIKKSIPKNNKKPRILAYSQWGYTAGQSTTVDGVISAAGGINIAAEKGVKNHVKLNEEYLVKWQPDYLLVGAEYGKVDLVRERLLKQPLLAHSYLAKENRIIIIESRYLNTVSQYIVLGLQQLVQALYPAKKSAS